MGTSTGSAVTLRKLLDGGRVEFRRMPYHGGDARTAINDLGDRLRFIVDNPDTLAIVVTPQAGGSGPYRIFPDAPVHAVYYRGTVTLRDEMPTFDDVFSLHNYGFHPRSGAPLFAGKSGWTRAVNPCVGDIDVQADVQDAGGDNGVTMSARYRW